MPRLSLAFFSAAVVYGVIGMVWGGVMGAHNDFVTAPAHAHLNLLGWVGLALMGTFYALAGPRAPIRLGWINPPPMPAPSPQLRPGQTVMLEPLAKAWLAAHRPEAAADGDT